jgi:predicted P-loop ATPase
MNTQPVKVALCNRKTDRKYKNREMSWQELKDRNAHPIRTSETIEEYPRLPKTQRDQLKDQGGFVGGWLKEGLRKNGHVISRTVGSLDADHIESGDDFPAKVKTALEGVSFFIYSTHSHTAENPRYRVVIRFSREVGEDEYPAVMRMVAKQIGMDFFDDSTYQANRMMYWASCPSDAEFVFADQDGEALDPDRYLGMYHDWKDASQWPVSSRQSEVIRSSMTSQSDPLAKDGLVGVFCRAYHPIDEAIETFLSDVYAPSVQEGRYDYLPADSSAGVVVYDGKFAYSHHASDPACDKTLNAFDLVRIHRFGDDDPTETFNAMADLASKDERVKMLILAERQAKARQEFSTDGDAEAWKKGLDREKRSMVLKNSLHNLKLILENDKALRHIVFNQLLDAIEITGEVPWQHPSRFWRDADDSQLISYIDANYGTFSSRNYDIAISKVADDRSYHPIRQYLDALPAWDGHVRAERIFIDYLGAPDTLYTKSVTRKTLCAAYKRVITPGCKFDSMPVLCGPQGIGKSTTIARLAGPWYSDSLHLSDTKDKTAAEKLQGYWILEVGELAGLRKAETETLRSFISRQNDIYRAAFGRRATPHPRQCIFIGTTNAQSGYLRDITGNRRFWPVNTPGGGEKRPWEMDDDEVRQIWAEVKCLVEAGEQLYLEPEVEAMAKDEQLDALEADEREGIVADYLATTLPSKWDAMDLGDRRAYLDGFGFVDGKPSGECIRTKVCTMEIWCECFGRERSMLRRGDSNEIVAILLKLGWNRSETKERVALYGPQFVFTPSVPENVAST